MHNKCMAQYGMHNTLISISRYNNAHMQALCEDHISTSHKTMHNLCYKTFFIKICWLNNNKPRETLQLNQIL